jgi:aspartyl-tRNA(Asn)/glutamyl-tRNA(Gln) amidotransferase subunit B
MPRSIASQEASKQVLGTLAKLMNDQKVAIYSVGNDFDRVVTATSTVIHKANIGVISQSVANTALYESLSRGITPEQYIADNDLEQISDTGAIESAIDAVIAANPDKAEEVREKPKMAGWFVGQVMKATGGKANPQAVNELLKKKLGVE